jgi:hypothetical protein
MIRIAPRHGPARAAQSGRAAFRRNLGAGIAHGGASIKRAARERRVIRSCARMTARGAGRVTSYR